MYHTLYHKRRFQGILCYTTDICNTWQKRKTSNNPLIITRLSRAENGTRTRDLNLGKVALYQLSYFRKSMFRNCECKGN